MIPYGRHSINEEDIAAVITVLKSDWLTTGPLIEQFENALEKVAGAPCITVSSGTAALHCAYAAIGLAPGDEVITPPITFIATQATAALFGATIVFADVQIDTGNIDPAAVESAITSKTKAIVAVDFAGHPVELDELRAIADKHGVYLIEDAAHSLGSTYRGEKIGAKADLTTFSFFPTKNIATGEGGAVSSNNSEILARAKRFSRQGLIREKENFVIKDQGPWHQEVHEFGLNYRLPDILCALGTSQLSRIDEFKKRRNDIFNFYRSELSNSIFAEPTKRDYVEPMWHLYPARVEAKFRLRVFESFRKSGVGVQVNYMPAYWHPVFKGMGFKIGQFPNSDAFYASEISLPMSFALSDEQVHKVVEVAKKI
jgi:UDP-4-amino-4,6-dideoxy-N-acetyl-beta-L-altrosamine transaminase